MIEPRRTKPERSFERILTLSLRHRLWGWDCPALDLDFLEYDNGEPVALIETKVVGEQPISRSNLKAFVGLARRANLPAFEVRHSSDLVFFVVYPLNDLAFKVLPEKTTMGETEYVSFLYRIRGRRVPDSVLEDLSRPVEPVVLRKEPCPVCAKTHLLFRHSEIELSPRTAPDWTEMPPPEFQEQLPLCFDGA